MSLFSTLCACLSVGLLLACSQEPDREGYEETALSTSMERKIPRQLWDRIEGESSEGVESRIRFVEVDVYLLEVNEGVLQKPRLKLRLPVGGGEVDLADFMGETKGSFYLDFEIAGLAESPFVYFVSQVQSSSDLGDELGSGCGVMANLSNKFSQWRKVGGLKLNSTRGRHVRVAGGDFVIFAKQEDKTLISRVSLVDRTQPEIFCKGYL